MRLELGNLALYIGRRMDKIKGAWPHRTVPNDCDSGSHTRLISEDLDPWRPKMVVPLKVSTFEMSMAMLSQCMPCKQLWYFLGMHWSIYVHILAMHIMCMHFIWHAYMGHVENKCDSWLELELHLTTRDAFKRRSKKNAEVDTFLLC